MVGRPEQEAETLQARLRETVEHVDVLRLKAFELTAAVRNLLVALALEWQTLTRSDVERAQRGEHHADDSDYSSRSRAA